MAKTDFTDGETPVTAAWLDSHYVTNGGHVHDGGSEDGHAPKIDLQNHVDWGDNGEMAVTEDVNSLGAGEGHVVTHRHTGGGSGMVAKFVSDVLEAVDKHVAPLVEATTEFLGDTFSLKSGQTVFSFLDYNNAEATLVARNTAKAYGQISDSGDRNGDYEGIGNPSHVAGSGNPYDIPLDDAASAVGDIVAIVTPLGGSTASGAPVIPHVEIVDTSTVRVTIYDHAGNGAEADFMFVAYY